MTGPANPPEIDARALALIEQLQLVPHPEGGYYREIYRSGSRVRPDDDRPARSALTTIYYLLPRDTNSRWHRVRSDEVWHLCEGGPIELLMAPPDLGSVERVLLGAPGMTLGPAHTVPAGWWQAARPRGPFALAGCTVGPGFEFEDFTFLRDDPAALQALRDLAPELVRLA